MLLICTIFIAKNGTEHFTAQNVYLHGLRANSLVKLSLSIQ